MIFPNLTKRESTLLAAEAFEFYLKLIYSYLIQLIHLPYNVMHKFWLLLHEVQAGLGELTGKLTGRSGGVSGFLQESHRVDSLKSSNNSYKNWSSEANIKSASKRERFRQTFIYCIQSTGLVNISYRRIRRSIHVWT